MSRDFKTYLVQDSVLDMDSSISYEIFRGPSQILHQQNQQNSASNQYNTIQHQYTVGNQTTMIANKMFHSHRLVVRLDFVNAPANLPVMRYGYDSSFASLATWWAAQTVILDLCNNAKTVSYYNDFPQYLRMSEEALKDYDLAPCAQDDYYRSYVDAAGSTNNPLGSYDSFKGKDMNRGAFPVVLGVALDGAGNVVPSGIPFGNAAGTVSVYAQIDVVLPVMISPLVWGKDKARAMKGLNTIKFQFTTGTGGLWNQVFRSASRFLTLVQPMSISNSQLLFDQYEDHKDFARPALNTLPYFEFNSFPFSVTGSSSPLTYANSIVNPVNAATVASGLFFAGAASTLQGFQSLTLNIVPQYMFLAIRKVRAVSLANDSDCYLPITKLNLTLGSASGLLNTANQPQLYNMSKRNYGQSWAAFRGIAEQVNGMNWIATTGSYVVLEFGKDIELADPSLAPGCLFNQTLNLSQIQVINNITKEETLAGNAFEIIVSFMFSGLYSILSGTSHYSIGLLDQGNVVNAVQLTPPEEMIFGDEEAIDRKAAGRHGLLGCMKSGGRRHRTRVAKHSHASGSGVAMGRSAGKLSKYM